MKPNFPCRIIFTILSEISFDVQNCMAIKKGISDIYLKMFLIFNM
jgi:hypothetical protein